MGSARTDIPATCAQRKSSNLAPHAPPICRARGRRPRCRAAPKSVISSDGNTSDAPDQIVHDSITDWRGSVRSLLHCNISTVCSDVHNICAGLGRNLPEAIALPPSDILSTEVGQWTRQNGFCDLPPNASLWRKSRGIARIRPYGVASHNDGYGVLNWSSSRTHWLSLLIQ